MSLDMGMGLAKFEEHKPNGNDAHLFEQERRAALAGTLPPKQAETFRVAAVSPQLVRSEKNPIIVQNFNSAWESFTTFNPAALEIDGETHILYRAQGHDYVSRLGYARSKDGFGIDFRDPLPAFEDTSLSQVTEPVDYGSGGSLGGAEDPRATLLDGVIYVFYVAYDGCSPPKLALTSIAKEDFMNRRWKKWAPPKIVSQPNIIDKSGALFPEKIKGKFVIMHRIFPDIQLDYRDSLEFGPGDHLNVQARIAASETGWDSRKIGAGAPPLKTRMGWLLIYYGVDDRDARQYKIGAMILDSEEPSKVLFRSSKPVLEPRAWYEHSGFKPGILYPCGAVIKGADLIVYYGCSDNFVGAASIDLEQFLKDLSAVDQPHTEPDKVPAKIHHNVPTTEGMEVRAVA